jgi:hypothetical protein
MDYLIDNCGEKVSQKGYDSMVLGPCNRILVEERGKFGFLDYTGEVVIPVNLEYAWLYSENEALASFRHEGKWGFLDVDGNVAIEPQFEYVSQYSDNIAAVKLNEKFGFIDKLGRWVIENQFDHVWDAKENCVGVCNDSKWGFFTTKGDLIVDCCFDLCDAFYEGLSIIKTKGKFGFVDTKGNVVVEPKYLSVRHFSEGVAAVSMDGVKWGFINKCGEVIIPFLYSDTMSFKEGLCAVSNGNYLGVIDIHNTIKLPFQYALQSNYASYYPYFENGLMVACKIKTQNSAFGLININGEEIIPMEFENVQLSSEGFTPVFNFKKAGYINVENIDASIPLKYDHVQRFLSGKAVVSIC